MRLGLTLLVDADDTLWENNIHFEEVIDHFCQLVGRYGIQKQQARLALNAIERRRTSVGGYGVSNFLSSLCEAYDDLLIQRENGDARLVLERLCGNLRRLPLTVLTGVRETLAELAGRHRVILFTKGDLDDQLDKVTRSGLRRYLHRVDVVREKNLEAYHDAIVRHAIRPEAGWMIGNSPRSDITPALAAGLGAVYVPHPSTWELEREELSAPNHPRLLVLSSFPELTEHF